jgi:hypothetical protein
MPLGTRRGPSTGDCRRSDGMRKLLLSVTIFAASAFAGPLIRFATWPPSKLGHESSIRDHIYDLVLLLWPTQPLAVIEVNVGTFLAVAISIGANILLFAVAGVIAGISSGQPVRLFAFYVAVCVVLVILALWNAGFSIASLNIIALSIAFVLYALPFWAVLKIKRPRGQV